MMSPDPGPTKGDRLRTRIVLLLLVVSLAPLAVLAAGAWVVFGGIIDGKARELQRTVVEDHAREIGAYLEERKSLLRTVAGGHSREELLEEGRLQRALDVLNAATSDGFLDLGVIGEDGEHLGYVGPYDLQHRNYRDAEWFRDVSASGELISDVFIGYRGVPHCIVAILVREPGAPWILRATIDGEQFDRIVRAEPLGEHGDVYILDGEGRYQTTPAVGSLLDPSPGPRPSRHRGVSESQLVVDERDVLRMTTWLNDDRWVLVVEQDAAEVRAPVRQAFASGTWLVALAVVLSSAAVFLSTRDLTRRIDRANAEREEMSRAFLRSARLASVGELATGLAHEINNPLAIIAAEQTNLLDLIRSDGDNTVGAELLESSERIGKQVTRCAGITAKLLQFGRQQEGTSAPTDLAPLLREIQNLLARQASVRNVRIELDVEEGLPRVRLNASELEQVLVNLIQNSFHAMPHGGCIRITAAVEAGAIHLVVADDGTGIPPGIRDRIFEPFFTTKPVGEGTGLGLSVCFGIVRSWGGTITADDAPGGGTRMHLTLPLPHGV